MIEAPPSSLLDTSPFDGMAPTYDDDFSHSLLGGYLRRAVHKSFDGFRPGDRILEIGCGTGEDAAYLARRGVRVLATDPSAGMIAETENKVAVQGLESLIETRQMAVEQLDELTDVEPFDGALSNFGPMNCVADLPGTARALARLVRPGGRALVVLMGPWVPWEWLWYLAHLRPDKAFRRLRRRGVPWRGLRIRYPSVSAARRSFRPHFRILEVRGVGALLPPTYAESWAKRHPKLIARLDRWERRWESLPPMTRLADHYVLDLERCP